MYMHMYVIYTLLFYTHSILIFIIIFFIFYNYFDNEILF